MLGLIVIWWEIPSHFSFALIATFGVPFIRGKIKIQYNTKTSTVGSTKDYCKEARVHFNLVMDRIKHRRSSQKIPFTWYDMKFHMETIFAVNLSLREFFLCVTIASNQLPALFFSKIRNYFKSFPGICYKGTPGWCSIYSTLLQPAQKALVCFGNGTQYTPISNFPFEAAKKKSFC